MSNNDIKKIIYSIQKMRDNDWQIIQSIRESYDPNSHAIIEPHFTLFSTKSNLQQVYLINGLHTISSMNKFNFTLSKASLMPPGLDHKSWYVFLVPEIGHDKFRELFSHICCGISMEGVNPLNFIPHLTIGSFKHKLDSINLINQINQSNIQLEGFIDEVLFADIFNNRLEIYHKMMLMSSG